MLFGKILAPTPRTSRSTLRVEAGTKATIDSTTTYGWILFIHGIIRKDIKQQNSPKDIKCDYVLFFDKKKHSLYLRRALFLINYNLNRERDLERVVVFIPKTPNNPRVTSRAIVLVTGLLIIFSRVDCSTLVLPRSCTSLSCGLTTD